MSGNDPSEGLCSPSDTGWQSSCFECFECHVYGTTKNSTYLVAFEKFCQLWNTKIIFKLIFWLLIGFNLPSWASKKHNFTLYAWFFVKQKFCQSWIFRGVLVKHILVYFTLTFQILVWTKFWIRNCQLL